jgi:hypothetical protein
MYKDRINDDTPCRLTELCPSMRVSRATVSRWRAAGYQPEFGQLTTPGHLKNWLRTVYAPLVQKKRARPEERLIQLK